MSDDLEPVLPTLAFKLPFFVLGVVLGMVIVWIALLWVPGVLRQAAGVFGG